MELKVGDKVRIKKDLEVKMYYSKNEKKPNMVMPDMKSHKGKIATITGIKGFNDIRIDLDGGHWGWVDSMFEEVITNKIPKLEAGMIVHCDTKEKAEIFLNECKNQNICSIYDSIFATWKCFGSKTCYRISKGGLYYGSKDCSYDDKKVIEFDELFKEDSASEQLIKVSDAFISLAKSLPKVSKNIQITESAEGNPVMLLPRYEVIYEREWFIDEDVEKVIQNGNCVIVILRSGEKGIAKCLQEDKFRLETGYNIAHAKAKAKMAKRMIKHYEEKLSKERDELKRYESYLEYMKS